MMFMQQPTDAAKTQQHQAAGQQLNAAQNEAPPTAQVSKAAAPQAPVAGQRSDISLPAGNRRGIATGADLMQEMQAEPESVSNTDITAQNGKSSSEVAA